MTEQKDLGLLVLRGAGFLLALTFGVQKIGWYWTAFYAGKSLFHAGLTPLITRMGFPIPIVLALWITFNESIGAFLIGCGLPTRLLAVSAALGMAGAFYTSILLGEDWLRAALYLIAFVALSLTGPGKFSVDDLIKSKNSFSPAVDVTNRFALRSSSLTAEIKIVGRGDIFDSRSLLFHRVRTNRKYRVRRDV